MLVLTSMWWVFKLDAVAGRGHRLLRRMPDAVLRATFSERLLDGVVSRSRFRCWCGEFHPLGGSAFSGQLMTAARGAVSGPVGPGLSMPLLLLPVSSRV